MGRDCCAITATRTATPVRMTTPSRKRPRSLLLPLFLVLSAATRAAGLLTTERFSECITDLNAADTSPIDGQISADEFVSFVAQFSDGDIEEMRFEDLPLGAVSNFNFVACQCVNNGGANDCCIGSNARIDLSFAGLFLVFCTGIETVIIEEAGPRPTPPPTAFPTRAPLPATAAPTAGPSLSPTIPPVVAPTAAPSPGATGSPTAGPTSSPITTPPTDPTSSPTPENLLCVDIKYGITNMLGITAQDVLNAIGNNIASDLIVATTTIVSQIIANNFPDLATRRSLASLSPEFPVTIDSVIDNPFCLPRQEDPTVECAIVSSTVCALLAPGDDADTVRATLTQLLREAVNDGSFVGAVPVRR